jgi:DNA-binding transcriptional regulator YiaG
MSTRLTNAQLRERLELSDAGLADFFGITRAAVAQWGDDDPVPELREMQAMQRKPELFQPPPAEAAAPASHARRA